MSFRITVSNSARTGVFDCERRKILYWLTAALWCECTQLQVRRSWEILQGAAQWAPVERGCLYSWPSSVLTQIRGLGSKVADADKKSPSIKPRLGFSLKFNPGCVTPTFYHLSIYSQPIFYCSQELAQGILKMTSAWVLCLPCVKMKADVLFTLCLGLLPSIVWVPETYTRLKDTWVKHTALPLYFFFLTAWFCLDTHLRPPYHGVHKGAADPKTRAKKLCLQQLRPPWGAQNQHSHCRQLLLQAITDSVSLSTVFKNSVNFKSATDVCLQPQDYICKKWILLLLFLMMVAQMRITGLWEIWAMLPQTIFPPPQYLCEVLRVKFTIQNWDMVAPTLNSDLGFLTCSLSYSPST